MKYKDFKNMLSKDDMKQIKGGNEGGGGPVVVSGNCIGSVGAWDYGSPVWYITCWGDIATYCSSGSGRCNTAS